MTRPSWDAYFLDLARLAATRATCPRKQVGAVIVRDKHVLATGYNGAPRGLPHCVDVGCDLQSGHCQSAVHAEVNAILQARCDLADSTIYSTAFPCWACFKLILNAGIHDVWYGDAYNPDPRVLDAAKKLHFTIAQVLP